MSNERELFEQYIKKEYPFLNLARSTTNPDEYSSATVCGFWEFWKAGIATMQDDVRKDAERFEWVITEGSQDIEGIITRNDYKDVRQAIDKARE